MRNDRIIELWKSDMSAGMVAREMGLTRNTVMGVVYRARRHGLIGHRDPTQVRAKKNLFMTAESQALRRMNGRISALRRWADHVKREPRVPEVPKAPGEPLPLDILELPSGRSVAWHAGGGCRHIAGDDVVNPQWCNAPTWGKSSWCAFHYRMVLRPGA